MKTYICRHCHMPFSAIPSAKRKYCTPKCAYGSSDRVAHIVPKDRGTGICQRCSREFVLTRNSGKARFCSQLCARSTTGSSTIRRNRRFAPNKWKCGWKTIGFSRYFFRSSWEMAYASYLERLLSLGIVHQWYYEPKAFSFPANEHLINTYTPDFLVVYRGHDGSTPREYHEVKGWMRERDRHKISMMARYYPTVRLVVIGPEWFKEHKIL